MLDSYYSLVAKLFYLLSIFWVDKFKDAYFLVELCEPTPLYKIELTDLFYFYFMFRRDSI